MVATSRRSIIILTFIGFAVFTSVPLIAQGARPGWEAELNTFFNQLGEGDYGKALDGLYATNPWLSTNRDQITQLKNQFVGLKQLVGGYIGHERVITQPVTGKFVYVMEAAFFEREPLQFHFTFYKAKDQWQLYTISYDEELDATAKTMALGKLTPK